MTQIKLDEEIGEILNDYSKEVKRACNEEAKKSVSYGVRKLRAVVIPGYTGRYAKGRASKKEVNQVGTESYTIYNRDRYQLTHLLEHGHVTKNQYGVYGRTPAHPHIAPVEAEVSEKYEKDLIERLSR